MTTLEILKNAISTGELLKISYEGGSSPGSIREITPIKIIEEKVSARCHSSNAVKTFVISKITILKGTESEKEITWQPQGSIEPKYPTLSSFHETHKNAWSSLGWHVVCEAEQLSLHRIRKNGTPLKGSDISLNFEEYSFDIVMDINGELHQENIKKRPRPWVVRGKNQETGTYSTLEKAAENFKIFFLICPETKKRITSDCGKKSIPATQI